MSGSSRQPGQDSIYMLANISDFPPTNISGSPFPPARRSLNPRGRTRGPWLLIEDRFFGGPNHGLTSFPPAPTPRPSAPLLYFDDTYHGRPDYPPLYHQPWNERGSTVEESRLSPEEQKQAVSKLRKQLYSPHINSIIRRLGTKSSTSNSPGGNLQDDDAVKRCAVCLEDFETRQFVTITPCNHMFHEECIVPWVKSQGKCPVCRFVIAEKSPPQWSRNDVASSRGGVGRNMIF
ncbi:hypothetical protein ACS0TY_017575 [Phlomoides rotata]